jgi:putative transposase
LKQLKNYRYKLKPSCRQSLILSQWLGACRYVYNLCLDYCKTLWQSCQLRLGKNEAQKELASLTKEVPWLNCVNSQTLQEVTDRLWLAYDGFFKSGKGFPRFAIRGRYRSFAFKQGVRLHPNTCMVHLPKLGKIKYRNSRVLPSDATIKRASVSQQADGWYLSLCVETELLLCQPPPMHM